MSVSAGNSPSVLTVAWTMLLDYRAGVASDHLQAHGVATILLKGPAIATWLYDHDETRTYRDVDLLVSPDQFKTAQCLLAELGYAQRVPGAAAAELGPRELDLVGPDKVCIDLHSGLLGTSAPLEHCFDVLAHHTTHLRLSSGVLVPVLDVAARTMHLALHAAQNGPVDVKACADLDRGLARVGRDDWKRAAALAEEIGATEAFAAALRLSPAGRELANELSLPSQMTVELALRVGSAPQQAIFFERLAETHGAKGKAALVARKVYPTEFSLRVNSLVARNGKSGLLLARLWRPMVLARQFPSAFTAWRRARRDTKPSSQA